MKWPPDQTCVWCGYRKKQSERSYCHSGECRAKYREANGIKPKPPKPRADLVARPGWSIETWGKRLDGMMEFYAQQEAKLFELTGVRRGYVPCCISDGLGIKGI